MPQEDAKGGEVPVLGEVWFPVGEVSVESVRERSASSALPPIYFLHVWFARRPLTTSRGGIASSILPYDANKKEFFKIHGIPTNIDIVRVYENFLKTKAEGRKSQNPFSWKRAFTHNLSEEESNWLS